MNYRGYSRKLADANATADPNNIGVKLGRICIAEDIPVLEISLSLEVTRQTIYSWFVGRVEPHPNMRKRIDMFIKNRLKADAE